MPDKPTELTVEAVVRAYVASRGSQPEAAARLGCNRKTVGKYLRSEEGQERLAKYAGEILEQYHVSATRVVGEAAAIAFSDLPRILQKAMTIETLNELDAHHRAAIAEVTCDSDGKVTRVKLHPKLDSLKLLAVYAEIAGLGAVPPEGAEGTAATRGEVGGLHITGPQEATITDEYREIPRPERLD